ncbi:hypothetical protein QOZ98_003025 [Planomicrobium stackebrandtii]|uniref:Uncharacterized protein n=1 Tax=Planomicrobium stackebrandtii TaxID=253160 RepID=A0ABU0GXU7_9BACL|nr:hypothetical protein [Planomicrobium stackebrandtii]MDQ0430187.1 hypothetical protein [Planomicrobium stackebrandtii]
MKKFIVATMVAFLSLSTMSSVAAHPHHDDRDDHEFSVREELAISKKALKKYRDIDVALDEGFVGLVPGACVPNMGIHLVKPSRADDAKLRIKKPEILVYEPLKDGSYKLVAAEWYVPAEETDKTPKLFKEEFQGPMDNHDGTPGQHYDLHAWLFKKNPDGMFSPENKRVSCQYAE